MSGSSVMTVGNGGGVRSTEQKERDKFRVVLVRAGVDPKAYAVPEGLETTIGALAETAKASLTNQIITVGAKRVDEKYVVKPGDVIFLVPQPKNS
jgi:hypothetical protein